MSLLVPSKTIMGEWAFTEGSHLDARPAITLGTTVTPAQNSYGTAVQVGADLTEDAWAIAFMVQGVSFPTEARNALTQIGFDFTGGTTFPTSPDRYNSITLLTSAAGTMKTGTGFGGVYYYFPLYIPSGTAILARGSSSHATVRTQLVSWRTFGRPKYPEATRRGSYVESLGITAATSTGTAITPGEASEGTAVSIGTLGAGLPCWYWEFGFGIGDTVTAAAAYYVDILRDSSTGPIVVRNGYVTTGTSEAVYKASSLDTNPIADVPGGTEMFGRSQCSDVPDSNIALAVYGVGG